MPKSLMSGPDKGWPDVAYNFFVDRYGRVWEGRQGSEAGPVLPDATGGSQGFAQICCFVGDHTSEPPTPEAQRAMTALLVALAERYGIDPTPGAQTAFVSRGSNRWAAGTEVTTTTIAGHRDMSLTTCPGDAAYPLVRDAFPAEVTAILAARATPPPVASPPPTATPVPGAAEASMPPVDGEAEAADRVDGSDLTTVAMVAAGGRRRGRYRARPAVARPFRIADEGCASPRDRGEPARPGALEETTGPVSQLPGR